MWETLKRAFKIKEIRVKIYLTIVFMIIYRIGCYIPVPGVGGGLITDDTLNNVTYLGIMSMMTGGALSNGTWLAMGIGPYINSSIIIQLLAVAIPRLERLSKEGESGRRKINNLTRYVAVLLAVIQSIGIILNYGKDALTVDGENASSLATLLGGQKWLAYTLTVIFYTSGALVTVWIGERITDYGVSNGISMLIFAGILASAGIYFIDMIRGMTVGGDEGMKSFWRFFAYLVTIIVIFGLIVCIENAERKIRVQYAKQIKGRKMMGGQSQEIPIKVNANGVMPLIFAFSIVSFPELIFTMFMKENNKVLVWWQKWMGTQSWVYMIVLCVLIFFFAFFYSQIQFNPEDVSRSIQQNGGFIQGIRPGKATSDYLAKVNKRITLFGAIFLAFMALVPAILFRYIDPTKSSVFSATGMLIVVSVALEFNTALESQIMMKNYKGFLK